MQFPGCRACSLWCSGLGLVRCGRRNDTVRQVGKRTRNGWVGMWACTMLRIGVNVSCVCAWHGVGTNRYVCGPQAPEQLGRIVEARPPFRRGERTLRRSLNYFL